MRTTLLVLLLGAALLAPAGSAMAAAPAPTPAPMLASSLGLPGGGPVLAFRRSRGGGAFGRRTSPGYNYPRSYNRSRYRTRRRGGGFFRGLFTGWLLSHFLGGYGFGIPIFPILLIGVVLWLTSRRRRRPSYGW